MNKPINHRRQLLLLAIIAVVIMHGTSFSALAQKSYNAKFPKPDFKVMEEYWEPVDYEYDYASPGIDEFYVVAKKKQEKVPRYWVITWRDAQGVKVYASTLMFNTVDVRNAKVGEPVRCSSYAPEIKDIPRIKSVVVTEHDEPEWAWNHVDASNTFFASLLDLNL